MKFVRRKSSNTGKVNPNEFAYLKEGFLNNICAEEIMNDILVDTGIHLLPVDNWKMAKLGCKNVVIKGSVDK